VKRIPVILFAIVCCATVCHGVEQTDELRINAESDTLMIIVPDSAFYTVPPDTTKAMTSAQQKMESARPIFKPNPQKSVWYALLFPGLGQIYNRRYWKLPIVYGGIAGLTYAITWNGKYYKDYSMAYRDIMDTNPNSKSYEKLLPYGTDPNSQWAKDILKQKQSFYRRNRDLSIIGAVAFFALTVVDAFVDAQLADFDISPDLSIQVAPAVIEPNEQFTTSVGMQLQLKF